MVRIVKFEKTWLCDWVKTWLRFSNCQLRVVEGVLYIGDYKAEHRVFEPGTLDGMHVRTCYPKVVSMEMWARRWFTTKLGYNNVTKIFSLLARAAALQSVAVRRSTGNIDVNMSTSNIRYSTSGWRNMTFRVSPQRATNATCQIGQEIMYFSGQIPLLLTQNVRKMIAPLAVTRPTKYSARWLRKIITTLAVTRQGSLF